MSNGDRVHISKSCLVIVIVFCWLWAALGGGLLIHSYTNDFLCYYIGGTIARQGHFADLYRPAAQMEIQKAVAPNLTEARPYVRPPWFALGMAPFTLLPLRIAYAVWVAIMLAVTLAIWKWGAAHFGEAALVLAALFFPANLGLCAGQDCAVMLAILCIAWALLDRDKPLLSGLVLGLGLIKPHLLLLFPLWMLLQRRWRMLAGFAIAGASLLATALVMLGTSGLTAYANVLLHGKTELGRHAPDKMLNIYSVPANFGIQSLPLNAALACLVLGLAAFGLWRAPAWLAIGIASAGSLLISPHVFEYDGALLLLPVWLVITTPTSKPVRYSALLLCAPVIFFFTLANHPLRCIPAVALFIFFVALVADPLWSKLRLALPAQRKPMVAALEG